MARHGAGGAKAEWVDVEGPKHEQLFAGKTGVSWDLPQVIPQGGDLARCESQVSFRTAGWRQAESFQRTVDSWNGRPENGGNFRGTPATIYPVHIVILAVRGARVRTALLRFPRSRRHHPYRAWKPGRPSEPSVGGEEVAPKGLSECRVGGVIAGHVLPKVPDAIEQSNGKIPTNS